MYQRILVPLDGSRYSEEVIPYAAGLASAHGTSLVLMRVVDKAADKVEATDYVEKLAGAYGAQGQCVLAAGDVADTVLDEAQRQAQTLVAMTSRGRSGLLEAVLGSVAQRVVRGSAAPVLVYHPIGSDNLDVSAVKIGSVVLPLDGSELSEAMAGEAAEFAAWLGATLEVVRVVEEPLSASQVGGDGVGLESGYVRSQATALAERYGVRINWDVLYGNDPAAAIAGYLAGRCDVILSMVTRRERALEVALLGSVTSGCVRRAGVPVLMRQP